MGLFSFLKSAGAKILGTSAAKNDAVNAEEALAAEKLARIDALKSVVNQNELAIENLSVDIEDDRVTVYGVTNDVATKEKVVLALGNVKGIATVDDRISIVDVEEPEPEADFYEVVSGDSLSKISKKYYGDAMKYNIIFEANQPLLKDPSLIYPGQMLRIPRI